MLAPQIAHSTPEERRQFVLERNHCRYPACGGCGSCRLPGKRPALEVFADYVEGRVEFVKIASQLWK